MAFTEQAVQHFVDSMDVFAAASGQTLNLQKTRILSMGRRPMLHSLLTLRGCEWSRRRRPSGSLFGHGLARQWWIGRNMWSISGHLTVAWPRGASAYLAGPLLPVDMDCQHSYFMQNFVELPHQRCLQPLNASQHVWWPAMLPLAHARYFMGWPQCTAREA